MRVRISAWPGKMRNEAAFSWGQTLPLDRLFIAVQAANSEEDLATKIIEKFAKDAPRLLDAPAIVDRIHREQAHLLESIKAAE